MASIFEELMRQNRELSESTTKKKAKKTVKEARKIKVNRIKVESRRIFEEEDLDELDAKFAINQDNPEEDEVVLVIDPELPAEGEEEPEVTAEEMIGDSVYKCPVCGANYLCDCDHAHEEGIELDDDGTPIECPICGDDTDQIYVGEIVPIEEVSSEEPVIEEPSEDPVEEPEKSEEEEEEEESGEPEESEEEEESDDDDEPEEEGLVLKKSVVSSNISDSYDFDERRFNSMIESVIKENYEGDPHYRVSSVSSRGNKLKISYLVTEGKKVTKGIMVAEGYDPTKRSITLKISDRGVFTESFTKEPAFTVECVRVRNVIVPLNLKYDYKVRMNEQLYRVFGEASSRKSK